MCRYPSPALIFGYFGFTLLEGKFESALAHYRGQKWALGRELKSVTDLALTFRVLGQVVSLSGIVFFSQAVPPVALFYKSG